MTERRHRERLVQQHVLRWLENQSAMDWKTAADIWRKMQEVFRSDDIPSRRTVESIVREFRPAISGGPEWNFWMASPSEAAVALPVLREKMKLGAGEKATISKEEVTVLAKVKAAFPDMGSWEAFVVSRGYLARVAKGWPPHQLNRYLAWRPAAGGRQIVETP